jgi:competence protein ComFC
MYTFFDTVWRYIGDIFFDILWDDIQNHTANPRDLTAHYRLDFPNIALHTLLVATQYSQIENMLESYKYHSERVYCDVFVDMLAEIIVTQDTTDAVLVAVPMHWSRYTLRGFDHMDMILRWLSKKLNIPYMQPLRAGFSMRQSKLSRAKRLENRKNRFTIDNSVILPHTVFLIDDVISTGATAHECARVLRDHGAEKLIGVFLASSAEL